MNTIARFRRGLRARVSRGVCALLIAMTCWTAPAAADLAPQPAKKKSMLIDKDRQGILDSDFATMRRSSCRARRST